jgi:hypothetical protein
MKTAFNLVFLLWLLAGLGSALFVSVYVLTLAVRFLS